MEYSILQQNGWKNDFNKADPGAFFHDKKRKIDMVLAYEDLGEGKYFIHKLFLLFDFIGTLIICYVLESKTPLFL